ETVPYMFEN
nr:RecName: Full=Flagellar filament outer layer protein flaA2; AltName: Full=35 kDa sheath protein [Brachyspira hyodysenteriae]